MSTTSRRPYGAGLSYRTMLHRQIMWYAPEIDVLEIPSEDFIIRCRRLPQDHDGRLLREAMEKVPSVAHGIHMSIGSVEPHAQPYLNHTFDVLEEFGLDTFSEHLTYHRMDGTDLLMFQCLPFEEVTARWVAAKYNQVRRGLRRPMALENVSYYSPVPECAMSEPEFLTRITELTDCRLLLDVTNIYNNATNHGYDPLDFLRRIPLSRVSQLHLAGGHYSDGMLQDSHSYPVMPPVWDLLHEVLRVTPADIVILERDDNFVPFEGVMKDVAKAREIFYQHRPARPPSTPAVAPETSPASQQNGNGEELDRLMADPEVQQLHQFQSATMAVITDPVIRRRWTDDPTGVAAHYGLDERWSRRLLGTDRKRMAILQRKWNVIVRDVQEEKDYYAGFEWREWARQSGMN